jgi:hypothetical protein
MACDDAGEEYESGSQAYAEDLYLAERQSACADYGDYKYCLYECLLREQLNEPIHMFNIG